MEGFPCGHRGTKMFTYLQCGGPRVLFTILMVTQKHPRCLQEFLPIPDGSAHQNAGTITDRQPSVSNNSMALQTTRIERKISQFSTLFPHHVVDILNIFTFCPRQPHHIPIHCLLFSIGPKGRFLVTLRKPLLRAFLTMDHHPQSAGSAAIFPTIFHNSNSTDCLLRKHATVADFSLFAV